MPTRLMVRALFVVATLAVVVDLATGSWWVGMLVAVAAWTGFVLLYRLKLRRETEAPYDPPR